jgi:hypothetical protein
MMSRFNHFLLASVLILPIPVMANTQAGFPISYTVSDLGASSPDVVIFSSNDEFIVESQRGQIILKGTYTVDGNSDLTMTVTNRPDSVDSSLLNNILGIGTSSPDEGNIFGGESGNNIIEWLERKLDVHQGSNLTGTVLSTGTDAFIITDTNIVSFLQRNGGTITLNGGNQPFQDLSNDINNPVAAPEPSMLALLLGSLAGLVFIHRLRFGRR